MRLHTTQGKNGDTSGHLALYGDGNFEDEFLDLLDGSGFDDGLLILFRTSCQIPQGGNGVALNLFIVLEG